MPMMNSTIFPPNLHNPILQEQYKPKNNPKNTLYINNLNEKVKLDGNNSAQLYISFSPKSNFLDLKEEL